MTGAGRIRCYRFADLDLDPGQRTVTRSGKRIRVGKLTFNFLSVLVQRAPNVVTHQELAQLVWPGRIVTPENMTQRMALLRRALGDAAKHPRYVRVVRGQGYQLIPPVAVVPVGEAIKSQMTRRAAIGASTSLVAVALIALIGAGSSTARHFIDRVAGLDRVASEAVNRSASSALQRWRIALRGSPDDQNDLVGLGTYLCESGRFTEALSDLRKARALYADSIVVLEALARCLVVSSDYKGAADAIAQGVQLNPRFGLRASPMNSGFEDGMYGWSLTYDKYYRAGPNRNFDFTIDTAVARSGRASGRLHSSIGSGQAATISTFVPIGFLGGKVRMSAYLKTEHVEQEAHLWLRVDSVLPGGIDTTYFENTANHPLIRGDTNWARYEIVADVPQTAAYIHYGYGLSGSGTVWIDDVQFEPVSAKTPLTVSRLPEPKVLPRPENLDFAHDLEGWSVRSAPSAEGHTGNVRVRDGAAALTVDHSQREIRQDVLAGNFAGQRVRLSVRLRRETSNGSLLAVMWFRTANYSVDVQPVANRWIADGDEWTTYDLVVDVPETSTKIMYWILAAGQGTLFVDDVRLEAVDESVPLTTMPTR